MARNSSNTRRVDALGRVSIPKGIRDEKNLKPGSPVEYFVEGETIILKEYVAKCVFCGNSDAIREVKGKYICCQCIRNLADLSVSSFHKISNQ